LEYRIEFEPVGRRGQCPAGGTLLECARYLGLDLVSICGGMGKCKTCKVQILKGRVNAPSPAEIELFPMPDIKAGWRLACLTRPEGDCTLYVPPESLTSLQRMQVEGQGGVIAPEPAVQRFQLEIPEPAFTDLRSDASRILDSLEQKYQKLCQAIDLKVLQGLSPDMRAWGWKTTAIVRENEIIALNPRGSRLLGLAIDLGTTKIAGYLMDLETGETLATRGLMNPQISYGEDITSRLYLALKSPEEASRLQSIAVSGLNQLAGELCTEAGARVTEITDAVMVGNTAMHHLILGLPVRQLSYPPFVAAVQSALDIKTRDIGLRMAPGAYIHVLPNIAGYVGADHVSMLMASEVLSSAGPVLAIDIGTNTEISLIFKGNITSVSCASGSAFEGGHISCGMRAADGAIERVKIEGGTLEYQTINRVPPTGICGSGIIDAAAEMYRAQILDESGKIKEGAAGVRLSANQREFVLVEKQGDRPAVVVSQRDIREVQLGKAAIRTGIQVLLNDSGCSDEDIKQVIIAGAFGTYIDVNSAILLGMLPAIPLVRFKQVGNAAGTGARQALLSISQRNEAQALARRIHYIELASAPGFAKIFVQAQYLGKYTLKEAKRIMLHSTN
jgi:uncharacterized 2Fe-2S/4Fe-4S cluster protein (DUF4445 family)